MNDPAILPATGQRAPSPPEPPAETEARLPALAGPETRDGPGRRSDALRAVLVDPGPSLPSREDGNRSGPWLSALLLVLAGAAAFVWYQPRPAPAPAAEDATAPSSSAVVEQPPAPTPTPQRAAPAAPAARPAAPVLKPVAITSEPDVAALMQRGLELETQDPAEAALAYVRAAIRGRERAAYYLGQFHETGTGVAPSLDLARLWYAAAADLPAAQRRLQALPAADAAQGPPAAPVPIFQARLSTGGSEMIWRLPDGVAAVRFRVEALDPAGKPLPGQETTIPGLVVPFPVSAWRVIAIGEEGAESAPSAMVRMIPEAG